MASTSHTLAALTLVTMMAAACSGNRSGSPTAPTAQTPSTPGGSGALVFRTSPIDVDAIRWITPLGNLNPPSHSLPTDHIYFYFANPNIGESPAARRTAFVAPGDGTVMDVFTSASIPDVKVFVTVSSTVMYYVDHLIPDIPITRGMRIAAGQRLGTTGSSYGVDLGVVNYALTLGFVNPSRYTNSDSLHADAPLTYYEEPLRSTLYAKVQRIGSDRDGKIDYDVAGRLSGNWFVENGATPLAFVCDTYNPEQVRISVPGLFSQAGVFSIAAGDTLPRDVSVASGSVRYTLSRSATGPPVSEPLAGYMLVQMLGDTRIRVETFQLSERADTFTGGARIFVR